MLRLMKGFEEFVMRCARAMGACVTIPDMPRVMV